MKRLILAAFVFAGFATVRAEPAAAPAQTFTNLASLMRDFAIQQQRAMIEIRKRQITALEEYLKGTNLADQISAQLALAGLHSSFRQHKQAVPLYESSYKMLLAAGTNAVFSDVSKAAEGLFRYKLENESKPAGRDFAQQVDKHFGNHPDAEGVANLKESFEFDLRRPVVGETMVIKCKAYDGRDIDLASMTGKVVLVDFWATWCGPCMAELPNVKTNYTEFHDKGFEIVGISLDKDKGKLTKKLAEENMTWPQRFSGEAGEDEIVKKFGIRGIPSMFLIGKDGKVVADDPYGDRLKKKLTELLGGS